MSRMINFGNVNISLAQFQKVSSGEHNAGEVRLTSDTTVGKVNNHVTMRSKNNVALSHEEVLAVKQAFVRTLSQSGVASDEIRRIRQELGLAAERAVDTSLKDRAIKPLSRQQVRDILDRNAATINARVGAGTIRASDELYAKVSAADRRTRAEKRDAVNAGLAARRDVAVNKDLARFESIVSGDLVYDTHDERKALLKVANTALETIMRRSGGHPRADVQADLALAMRGGDKSFTFAPGMSEARFAAALEKMVARLSVENLVPANFEPDASKPEAWRAWAPEACATTEARANPKLVDALVSAALRATEGRPESRKAVFADLDSLFVAGGRLRKPWDVARSIRESQVQPQEPAQPGAQRKIDWASLSDKAFNSKIVDCFNTDVNALPAEFREMVYAVRDELRLKFGATVDKVFLETLVRYTFIKERLEAPGAPRATPEGMVAWYRELAAADTAEAFLRDELAPVLQRNGLTNPVAFKTNLMKTHPQLIVQLADAPNIAVARGIVAEHLPDIEAGIRRQKDCAAARAALPAKACALLNERLGIPAASLAATMPDGPQRLRDLATRLADDILSRKHPADTREEIEAAFDEVAERYVKELADVFAKIDALAVSAPAKSRMKAYALDMNKTDYLDFDAIAAAARALPSDELRSRLAANAPKEAVFEAMKTIHEKKMEAVNRLFAEARSRGKEVGQDEIMNVTVMILECFLDATPGLRDAVGAFLRREDVLSGGVQTDNLSFYAWDFQNVFKEPNAA